MYERGSFHILLVHPPVESPAVPPLAPAKAAGFFAGSNLSLEHYDANLDFFVNYLLTPEILTGCVDLIKTRGKQRIGDDADPFFLSLFDNLETNAEQWTRKINRVEQSVASLRTEDFYRPESCLAALTDIDDLLDLASLAYHPSRIQRGRFSNPHVQNLSQAKRFVEDSQSNPFLPFCRDQLTFRIARTRPGLVILFVSVPDQVIAALTIAKSCKKQYPGLHVVLVGSQELLAGGEDYGDSLLPDNDPEALSELIAGLVDSPLTAHSADPDFSGLPLNDYLAPAVALPFEGISGLREEGTPPSGLMAYLLKQQQRYDARCFISNDVHLTPAYIAKAAEEREETRPSFCIGLSCALKASTGAENTAEAFEAGLRLIHWHHPKGELKALTKLLWDVSRAGIWNHVVVDTEGESSLVQGLIQFVAANPNIIHSWLEQPPCITPFDCPPKQPEQSPGAYIQVAPLPGQPLWKRLNEPVYRLLYLDEHGLKKLMRLRVRDDLKSVYSLGQNMTYHFVPPHELPPGFLDEICRMVEAGGSVGARWVRYNLERAFLIGYVMEEGMIVGNSSLKYPRSEYVEAVNRQAGLDLTDYLERGYTSVRPEYRGMGIGTRLLEGLTARVGKKKLYSIISSDNIATRKIAIRNNTRQVATFYSERLGKEIGVWIPDWMIE